MKRVSILGSTGSIGSQTIEVLRQHKKRFSVVGVSGRNELEKLEQQIKEFSPKIACVELKEDAEKLREKSRRTEIVFGEKGLQEVATLREADTVIGALVGFLGLKPTLKAIKAGKNIALANKETLVAAGHLVMKEVQKQGVILTPIDSEHSAIFQCLRGENRKEVKRIIITCSGGPFKFKKASELESVSVEDALGHPTWNMGAKITIDSATLMNKGLEVIEAHWLYGMPFEKIETILHPQSIVHSMVEFCDGSIVAQLGTHDMRMPIQFALSYPERFPNSFPTLNLLETQKLEFYEIDHETFPCINYAYEAGKLQGTLPCAMNAANEEAVYAFLQKKHKFLDIPATVRKVMDSHKNKKNPSLEEVLEADKSAREEARRVMEKL